MGKHRHTEAQGYDDLRRLTWVGEWMRQHRLGDPLPRGKRFRAGVLLQNRGPYGRIFRAVFIDPFPLPSDQSKSPS